MLRRLDLKEPWRSLDQGFWPDALPLGRRTIIYGHNGSGKSTLSELLLSLSNGAAPTEVVWEDENKRRTKIRAGAATPAPQLTVFTRKWVEENLAAFLDGNKAAAIVTLGKEAIDAQEEESRLIEEVARLRAEAQEADAQHKTATAQALKLARDVQEDIVSRLKVFNYDYYTKSRFSIPRVQQGLRKHFQHFPDSGQHAEALKCLAEDALRTITPISEPPAQAARHLSDLATLLTEVPTRVAVQELENNPDAQGWAEQGIALHEERESCLFCDGEIGDARRALLARHFDESWLRIRGRANALRAKILDEREVLSAWRNNLPPKDALASNLRDLYAKAIQDVNFEVEARLTALNAVERALKEKADQPSATPQAADWSVLDSTLPTASLKRLIEEQNDQASRHAELTDHWQSVVLDHLIGSQSAVFRELEEEASEASTTRDKADAAASEAEDRLNGLRQAKFTTKEMADTLTRDLARVYGKGHLNVVVTSDGKSYACRRGEKPGTDLSDGERMTLSLLYFLRRLNDEQSPGEEPGRRTVVIDDPSSSLDREAVFATHQWLLDTLDEFGQYIILTHDFNLLRLFVKSHKNSWNRTVTKIKKGDVDEILFPKVSFLEMYASTRESERRTNVGQLPRVLVQNTSEYAYLFTMVMKGIDDPEDHERLFLLPNAARRMLEVFASYKAPHRTDFLQQLAVLIESEEGEPHRDVYDFCNRYSHGEGSESIDVLDARAVHSQIRRCMEFLRSVDRQHFERMCSATDVDPAILA